MIIILDRWWDGKRDGKGGPIGVEDRFSLRH